ncbi:flavin reductase [Ekhidna sp. To15]|uniref:flavin reductase n=1 Tax=Ekhidna sp. To15 TaxID=3395267 RepID=UPI003F527426
MGLKRPWNIVDVPVYSLATYDGDRVNMNICTYVTAVSMKPKIFMIAVYYGTRTLDLLENSNVAVLQILHQNHSPLVRPLGKKSGNSFDKGEFLASKNLLTQWNGKQVLKDACGYLQFEKIDRKNIGGDHELFWFEVKKSKTISEHNVLMFQNLVKEGIIL